MAGEVIMLYRWALLAAAVVALGGGSSPAAAPPDDKGARKEVARLEGDWELVRPEGSTDVALRLEFKGGKLTVVWIGMASLPAEMTLYPDTDPKCIDVEFKKVRREHYEGIYKVEKDTLRLALAPSDVKERPTKIPERAEPGKVYFFGVFKRMRP